MQPHLKAECEWWVLNCFDVCTSNLEQLVLVGVQHWKKYTKEIQLRRNWRMTKKCWSTKDERGTGNTPQPRHVTKIREMKFWKDSKRYDDAVYVCTVFKILGVFQRKNWILKKCWLDYSEEGTNTKTATSLIWICDLSSLRTRQSNKLLWKVTELQSVSWARQGSGTKAWWDDREMEEESGKMCATHQVIVWSCGVRHLAWVLKSTLKLIP